MVRSCSPALNGLRLGQEFEASLDSRARTCLCHLFPKTKKEKNTTAKKKKKKIRREKFSKSLYGYLDFFEKNRNTINSSWKGTRFGFFCDRKGGFLRKRLNAEAFIPRLRKKRTL